MGYYDQNREVYHFFTLGDVYLEPDDKLATFVPQQLQPPTIGTVELNYSARHTLPQSSEMRSSAAQL